MVLIPDTTSRITPSPTVNKTATTTANQTPKAANKTAKQSALSKGIWAEALVAHWLQAQGWEILHRRWHSPVGELDLVARSLTPSPTLAFVEVKARSSGNWDAGGLLAVTPRKQTKLWQTAHLFLAQSPDSANLPCSFDVAIVQCRRSHLPKIAHPPDPLHLQISKPVELGERVAIAGYDLTLEQYIWGAFDLPSL
ncbi:MAG: YraN family protein [Oculatellaceae cyanobacterium Prado106]|jgi:putative endonuclease|nr:YraN family protein [Oculatellaceae cyanobacterium Prado106]